MSASNPGPVRRFFRTLWRLVDASRRVVLNLVFLFILGLIVVALIKTGPAPIADKTALVLRLDQRAEDRHAALERVGSGARRGGAEDPAARCHRRARDRRR
jgi:hypothetical protein